jgi:hypothetical protein
MCHPSKPRPAQSAKPQSLDDRDISRGTASAVVFSIDTRLGMWRVTLNGLFFGAYPSAVRAQKAIDDAHRAFATLGVATLKE